MCEQKSSKEVSPVEVSPIISMANKIVQPCSRSSDRGGQTFWFAGRLKKFSGPWPYFCKTENWKIMYLHETQIHYVEKSLLGAGQKTLTGRIWPADRTLPTL